MRDFIKDDWPLILIILIMVLWISGQVWAKAKEDADWESFKATHHCELVGKVESAASISTMAVDPRHKEIWRCDAATTYWR